MARRQKLLSTYKEQLVHSILKKMAKTDGINKQRMERLQKSTEANLNIREMLT
jgi:hypothetical protein